MTPPPPTRAGALLCPAVAARTFELLDGELDPALSRMVRRHLRGCARCREELVRQRALLARIARAARFSPAPPSLVARVRHELAVHR